MLRKFFKVWIGGSTARATGASRVIAVSGGTSKNQGIKSSVFFKSQRQHQSLNSSTNVAEDRAWKRLADNTTDEQKHVHVREEFAVEFEMGKVPKKFGTAQLHRELDEY
jgi:hypothetical protein